MPILSIYIPVYNSEKYLPRCLDSVLNQTFSDIEIFIYDDGSTDDSYSICQQYAKLDQRIKLEHGANGGSTLKMNEFVKKAQGKYIGFVDHDDVLEIDYLQRMMSPLVEQEADCVVGSYTCIDEHGRKINWYTPELTEGQCMTGREVFRKFLTSLDIEGFRWNKIYKKDIFIDNKVEFPNKFPADIVTEARLLLLCNTVVTTSSKGYYYRQLASSELATADIAKEQGFLEAFHYVSQLAKENVFLQEAEYYMICRCVYSLFNTYRNRKKYKSSSWRIFKKQTDIRKMLGKNMIHSMQLVRRGNDRNFSSIKFMIKIMVCFIVY